MKSKLSWTLILAGFIGLAWVTSSWAADHGDSPLVSNEQGVDIDDVYQFLDPNDNNFMVLMITARSFITPGENANQGFFQVNTNWRFGIENTGDATVDMNLEVTFSPREGAAIPQTAFVKVRQGTTPTASFTAPTTISSATATTAPAFVVTTDPTTNISVFAGLIDDPFFFDLPAELLYRASLQANAPNPSVFSRGRDAFAGYNILGLALRVPVAMLRGSAGNVIGYSGYLELQQRTKRSRNLGVREKGRFITMDRMGIPAINTVFIPFSRKDEYNRGSGDQDKAGVFANSIVPSIQGLQTNAANLTILADLAVNNGDFLRLNTTIMNTGTGGGTNIAAAFPNGRRLADDVIDTIVNIISNQAFGSGPVDNVNANEKPFLNTFPFFAAPHQPRAAGTIDDATRN